MTNAVLSVSGFQPYTFDMAIEPPPVYKYAGYRCLHYAEGGDWHELGKPAVHNSESLAGIDFTRSMQLLSYNINQRANPNFTGNRWRSVYGNTTAFTNGNGFDKDGDPRADFVNMRETDKDLPKLMRAIICSGSLYRGDVMDMPKGKMLTLAPGVDGIDVNKPVEFTDAFMDMVIERNWYFWAVSADMNAASHFSQGAGKGVIMPLFLATTTQYPLSWFTPWSSNDLPNPTTFYWRA